MTRKGGVAVVFWGPSSISTEMFARRLKATCYLIHYLSWKRPWIAPLKYPPMWLKTWWVLLRQRPSAVLVINTPVFAPLCVYFYCLVARIPFAMNVHGHTLSGRRWGWSRPLQHFLARKAAVNLVDTSEYKEIFETWGANILYLEEPMIEIPQCNVPYDFDPGEFHITVVSTFAGDEPLELVIESACRLPGFRFYITGDTGLAKKGFLESAPSNVVFTGYLNGNDYWNQLYSSQAILTLTTNPYSLVAGGIEGMYIGKPLILSRQPALLEYFTKGAVFIDHSVESLVAGAQLAREQEDILARESTELAADKRASSESKFNRLEHILGASCE